MREPQGHRHLTGLGKPRDHRREQAELFPVGCLHLRSGLVGRHCQLIELLDRLDRDDAGAPHMHENDGPGDLEEIGSRVADPLDVIQRRELGVGFLDDVVDVEVVRESPAAKLRAQAALMRQDMAAEPCRAFIREIEPPSHERAVPPPIIVLFGQDVSRSQLAHK
nr:hypothetical protein [Sphingobium xanthum]